MRLTLPGEIAALLAASSVPLTASQIAVSVRARRADVEEALAAGPFQEALPPLGANQRSTHWANASVASPAVPALLKGSGRSARLLAVLRDGRWHSRDEILQLSPGPFFLVNNAASDLRRKGYTVECRSAGRQYAYRLVSAPALEEPAAPAMTAAGSSSAAPLEEPTAARACAVVGSSSGGHATQGDPAGGDFSAPLETAAAPELFEQPRRGAYSEDQAA